MLLLVALVAVAGCETAAPATPMPVASPTAAAGSPATSTPAPAASATGAVPSRTTPLVIDPGLLTILPREIDGHAVNESPEVEAADLADPSIPREVNALAAAFVHDDAMTNWAVATVVALRPGVLSETFYRGWQRTFNEGACEPAGGVTGSASSSIGGRAVEIGRCAGGVNTYHVRLTGDRLVSITAFGDRRYGELLLADLTEKPA